MTGKIRRMAAEFQGQFNEAMREAELDDVKQQIQGVNESVSSVNTNFNPIQTIRDELKGAVEGTGASPASKPAASRYRMLPRFTAGGRAGDSSDRAERPNCRRQSLPADRRILPKSVAAAVQKSAAAASPAPAAAPAPEPQVAAAKPHRESRMSTVEDDIEASRAR